MKIIDFHSHVLPQIDDGSKSIEMSKLMLEEAVQQNVDIMVATPHFYAERSSIESFLEKRKAAGEFLREQLQGCVPRLILGSETAFFSGIGSADGIERLCIENTRFLLLEMPFREWGSYDFREIDELICRGIIPIIAHVERYYRFQKSKHAVEELMEFPIYFQVNAESLLDWRMKGKVLKLFKDKKVQLLGSDCHNLENRAPNLKKGRDVLERKLGKGYLDAIDRLGEKILGLTE